MLENAWQVDTTGALTTLMLLTHITLPVHQPDFPIPGVGKDHSGGIPTKVHMVGRTDSHHTATVSTLILGLGVKVKIDHSLKEVRRGLTHAYSELTGIDQGKVWWPG